MCLAYFARLADAPFSDLLRNLELPGDIAKLINLSEVFGHGASVGVILVALFFGVPDRRSAILFAILITATSGLLSNAAKMCFVRIRPHAEHEMQVREGESGNFREIAGIVVHSGSPPAIDNTTASPMRPPQHPSDDRGTEHPSGGSHSGTEHSGEHPAARHSGTEKQSGTEHPRRELLESESPETVAFGSWDSRQRSFPSGHAATAWGLAIGLSLFVPRLTWLFGMLAVLASVQRLTSGAHFLSDVCAGAAIAFASGGWLLWLPTRRLLVKPKAGA